LAFSLLRRSAPMSPRLRQWFLLAAFATALAGPGPALLAWASQMPGQAVVIGGLDDMAATTDANMRGGPGRMAAYIMGGFAMLSLMTGYVMPAGLMGGGSFGLAFVPPIYSSLFDAAPAATLDLARLVEPAISTVWWAPFSAFLWPVLSALHAGGAPC